MEPRHDARIIDGTLPSLDWQRLTRPVAILPLGAFEQHGPHLPLLTDTLKVEYFARGLAHSLGAALLPPMSIGQSFEHSGFRGSLSLRPETFMNVIRDIAAELERQSFTRLVIVNGHGGNWALGPAVREINRSDRALKVIIANYWECDSSQEGRTLAGDGIHAGAWETAIMLALFPHLVGDHSAVVPTSFDENEKQSDLNHLGMGVLRPNGVWGDPRKASAEAGRAIAKSIETNLPAFVEKRMAWLDKEASYAGPGPVVVRPMTENDFADGMRLCHSAGWNQCVEDWAFFYRGNPSGCFVAQHNGKTVGTVTTMCYDGGTGWIAMVLVEPVMRHRGIGTTLLMTAIDALAACTCIKLDATPAGKGVYQKLGFEEEYRLSRMINRNVQAIAPVASVPVRPMEESDVKRVTQLDTEAFGIARPAVVEEFLQRAPEYAQVSELHGRITGFCLGRRGTQFEQIGPVVARDGRTARALVETVLRTLEGRGALIDVPQQDTAWMAWLRSLGFEEQRSFTRMYRGENTQPPPHPLLYASSGPELG